MKPASLMRGIMAAFAVVMAPTAAPAHAQDNAADRWLTAEQVQSDIALAQEAYSRIHPGYTRYASDAELRAAWAEIDNRARAEGGMALGDLYLAVELALTTIRCDHTKAELPKAMRKVREGKPLYLPFLWQLIEGRGLIELASADSGLGRGEEIVAIDGRPLEEVVASVSPYIPVDGYTDWAKRAGIAQSLEFMGGAVDHFGILLWDTPATANLTIRNAEGSERTVMADRISFEEWSALGRDLGNAANFKDAVHFERVGDNTGYLKVDTFVNYRDPVDPHEVLSPVFEAMLAERRGTLILDLRENGGGSTDASQALTSYLLEEAMPLKLSMKVATLDLSGLKENLTTWDVRALNPDPRGFIANEDGTYTLRDGIMDDTKVIAPADAAFRGRLLVLTSNSNSSGSTNLLAILEQQERTTLIGERTGGSAEGPTAGILLTLTLPESGIRTRIPLFRYKNNVNTFEPGMGLSPDIAASMTVEDFRSGNDPALMAAKALSNMATPITEPRDQEPLASITDFTPMLGEVWSGELEYLNYGSTERSTISVQMIARDMGKRSLSYGVIYPGETHMNAREKLRISRDGRQIDGNTITQRNVAADGVLTLVTEGNGRDDNRPADIRMTYKIGADYFSIRKDVRFAGAEYINRNEYRLTR
ncbi:S41 family peptidase [Pontixanthobacter sp. CEM42]|uniref:S41 family peptidase n=1 Tax=Pontixanthobacter sp. CEM42 TaxID=2792077 RepID=UPI001ADF132F|nr:S41 family peptidase [Pontixanthobacter sp. CEM42]